VGGDLYGRQTRIPAVISSDSGPAEAVRSRNNPLRINDLREYAPRQSGAGTGAHPPVSGFLGVPSRPSRYAINELPASIRVGGSSFQLVSAILAYVEVTLRNRSPPTA